MAGLNAESLFSIFSQGDEEVYKEHGVEDILDNSFVLIGMVIKSVENYYIIDQIYTQKYKKDYELFRDDLKLKYFSRLLTYLKRINVANMGVISSLRGEFDDSSIQYSFNELLIFFEEREMYEECAEIISVLNAIFDK